VNEAIEALRANGYPLLFLAVLLDQLGLPLPSIPILLAAGALVGLGHLGLGPALLIILLAALLGDLLWYELGRRKGATILKFLCRVSLEPDSCVRATEGVFEKYGVRCLLFAKFVPGLYTVTPPVAGIVGLKLRRFILFDTLGILIWAGVYVGLGALMSHQLEWLLMKVEAWGTSMVQVVVFLIAAHVLYKFIARQRFLRQLRTARITPEELKQMLDDGTEVMIADLRHSSELAQNPFVIPGALVLSIDHLEHRHSELPRDREIILYCT
jgi:membrane protein DedA with SNARE-associated domain